MEIAVILKSDPFSWKAIQAYKIAAALSFKAKVYFIAIKEGVYFLTDWNPEALGYENFKAYEVNSENLIFIADKDDFEVRGLNKHPLWVNDLKLLSEEEIAKVIEKTQKVGVW
jgi:hypothetical protein